MNVTHSALYDVGMLVHCLLTNTSNIVLTQRSTTVGSTTVDVEILYIETIATLSYTLNKFLVCQVIFFIKAENCDK